MDISNYMRIINAYGTPLYIYDLGKIISQIKILKKALIREVKIFYSLKANPSIGLLTYIKDHVSGVEVSSEGELYLARHVGIPAEKIIFVGPGKTEEELRYAIESDILSIAVESFSELNKINYISRQLDKKTRIAVRLNPKFEVGGARIKMGGSVKQFGIDEERLGEFVEEAGKCNNVILEGLHVYMGTQVLDAGVLVENFKNIFNLAKTMQNDCGVKVKLIDFGGGFGIPYFPGEKELDLKLLKEGLYELFHENSTIFDYENMDLLVESGRFLVAESGVFLTRVLYKKHSRGKTFIITDGGSNNHASAAGIGRFIRHNFPIEVVGKQSINEREVVDIVGPLCTPTDVLAQGVELPVINEGDVIAILKSGAYGLSASMKDFLSHPAPAEVLIDGDRHWLIRRRGTREDFLAGQAF
ncbi:MAG: diaminopimelate decarboxylase [Firmicutes bacterium]|nr:diaminopimelate decarboxylase [Bacillota bacterium]